MNEINPNPQHFTAWTAMEQIAATAAMIKFNGGDNKVVKAYVTHQMKTSAWYNLPLPSGKMYELNVEQYLAKVRKFYAVKLAQLQSIQKNASCKIYATYNGWVSDLSKAAEVNGSAARMVEIMNPEYLGYINWECI